MCVIDYFGSLPAGGWNGSGTGTSWYRRSLRLLAVCEDTNKTQSGSMCICPERIQRIPNMCVTDFRWLSACFTAD